MRLRGSGWLECGDPATAGPLFKVRHAADGQTRRGEANPSCGGRGHVRPLRKCIAISPDFGNQANMSWPHGPTHWLFEPGLYMVTAGTYLKLPHLNSAERLNMFLQSLFECSAEFRWDLRAWAILANHYHFVALSPTESNTLRKFVGKLHMQTAKQLNTWDNTLGRRIWFQYWDSHITFERSYLARLNYVHQNPVHHGIAAVAENYKWCSASWFSRNASPAFVKTVKSFKIDRLNVPDDF